MSRYSIQGSSSAALSHASREDEAAAEPSWQLRMRRGRALVVSGFAVAVLGVLGYCAVCFAGGVHHELGQLLLESSTPFITTLAVIGTGTALWLVGSMTYLAAAMDADELEEEQAAPHDHRRG